MRVAAHATKRFRTGELAELAGYIREGAAVTVGMSTVPRELFWSSSTSRSRIGQVRARRCGRREEGDGAGSGRRLRDRRFLPSWSRFSVRVFHHGRSLSHAPLRQCCIAAVWALAAAKGFLKRLAFRQWENTASCF
jgi:hypothetical protein